jgi:hypothetical protein
MILGELEWVALNLFNSGNIFRDLTTKY